MELYYSMLKQEPGTSELWVRENGEIRPVFDYKIDRDFIRLISDKDMSVLEAVTLKELSDYVETEGNSRLVPYTVVDELTGQNLDIKDRLGDKLIFEICN